MSHVSSFRSTGVRILLATTMLFTLLIPIAAVSQTELSAQAATVSDGLFTFDANGASQIYLTPTLAPGVQWNAQSYFWITLDRLSGTGSTTIIFNVLPNYTGTPRKGFIRFVSPQTGETLEEYTIFQSRTAKLFQDVPLQDSSPSTVSVHFDTVNLMYANGITSGCQTSPLLYCPSDIATRAQMAIFFVRAWSLKLFGSTEGFRYYAPPSQTPYFVDVPYGSFGFDYIQKLYELGVTSGCQAQPRMYCPNDGGTNLQAAIFAVRTRQLVDYRCSYNCINDNFGYPQSIIFFSDVQPYDGDFKWVQKVATSPFYPDPASLRIVSNSVASPGCFSGGFCKNQPITRGQLSLYIVRGPMQDLQNLSLAEMYLLSKTLLYSTS
ncbi:MAG: BACON domain-containing protein, partial [Acidobacteriota bacterium]